MKQLNQMKIDELKNFWAELEKYEAAVTLGDDYYLSSNDYDLENVTHILRERVLFILVKRRLEEVGVVLPDHLFRFDDEWGHLLDNHLLNEDSFDDYDLLFEEQMEYGDAIMGDFISVMESCGWKFVESVPDEVLCAYKDDPDIEAAFCESVYSDKVAFVVEDYYSSLFDGMPDQERSMCLAKDLLEAQWSDYIANCRLISFRSEKIGLMWSLMQVNSGLKELESAKVGKHLIERMAYPLYQNINAVAGGYFSSETGEYVIQISEGCCCEEGSSVGFYMLRSVSFACVFLLDRACDLFFKEIHAEGGCIGERENQTAARV